MFPGPVTSRTRPGQAAAYSSAIARVRSVLQSSPTTSSTAKSVRCASTPSIASRR